RRTAPPPAMVSFDAGSREVCTANREITATPLQSLVLLNDPQFVEAARVLAERLLRESAASDDERWARGFERVLGRLPTDRERDILRKLYAEQRDLYRADPAAAERLIKTGEQPPDTSLPVPELAAGTLVVSALMNHDEFVMKR
ncbi:MAG: DUF1553 domain-containing protein, partial [Verrucomicrobiae bacterium]|nr:DUF1553 domain-containing protein [Verrucomicrobiae bacterium]